MTSKELTHKKYLGDGVYCGFDGFQIWLYTSNGLVEENFIALEPDVMASLYRYARRLRGPDHD